MGPRACLDAAERKISYGIKKEWFVEARVKINYGAGGRHSTKLIYLYPFVPRSVGCANKSGGLLHSAQILDYNGVIGERS
jgi:hypothetical protein